jgi:presenilin-like A22 family membrane protease
MRSSGRLSLKLIEYRQMIQILAIFMLVQFAGILLATQLFNNQTYSSATANQLSNTPISALFFVFYIIVLTALILVIFRYFKADKIIVLWERAIILITCFFVFYLIMSSISSGIGYTPPQYLFSGIAAVLAFLFLYEKVRKPGLKNSAAIISSIGVGLILGLGFGPVAALFLIMILAVYDFIAVFITKHMITLANVAMQNNLALMVDVNEYAAVPKSSMSKEQLSAYDKAVRENQIKIPKEVSGAVAKGNITIPASVGLGTGDLAVPLMVAISSYKLYLNFTLSIFIAIGGTFGLILTMFILRRYKRALPAIPPILFGILCSLLAYFLVFAKPPF